MKPIIQEETQDTILTKDITEQHIVVAVIDGCPCILNKGFYDDDKDLAFKIISRDFTNGNCYRFGGENTIQRMVEFAIQNKKATVAVFHQSDWKQALQWLIDNA